MEITWNNFATSHGKDQVDGIGGSVKCDVFDKVLSNQYQMDFASIFVIAAQNMPHIKVFKMKSAEINKCDKMGSTKSSVVCRIRYSYYLDGMNAPSQCTFSFTIKNK